MSAQQLPKPGAVYAYVRIVCAKWSQIPAVRCLKCPELLQALQFIKDDGLCFPPGCKPRFALCRSPCHCEARLEAHLPPLPFPHWDWLMVSFIKWWFHAQGQKLHPALILLQNACFAVCVLPSTVLMHAGSASTLSSALRGWDTLKGWQQASKLLASG